MKKKNDVSIVAATKENDLDDISIDSNDVDTPVRKGFFARKDKSADKH